jgi:hypothetical protein
MRRKKLRLIGFSSAPSERSWEVQMMKINLFYKLNMISFFFFSNFKKLFNDRFAQVNIILIDSDVNNCKITQSPLTKSLGLLAHKISLKSINNLSEQAANIYALEEFNLILNDIVNQLDIDIIKPELIELIEEMKVALINSPEKIIRNLEI